MALYLDVGPNDLLCVGDHTVIAIERKSGGKARLKITGTGNVELLKKARLSPPAPPVEEPTSGRGN